VTIANVHTIVRGERRGDCCQCRVRLSCSVHGKRSFFKCRECDVYVCVGCFAAHVDAANVAERKPDDSEEEESAGVADDDE